MFLTVIVSILTITTAIRVPTAWPDYQDQQIQDLHPEQDTHVLNIPRNSFQTLIHHQAKQPLNQPNTQGFYVQNPDPQSAPAAGYVNAAPYAQYPRRPSGSPAKNLIENHHKHAPDVAYNYNEPHSPINNKRPLTSAASYENNNSKPRAHYHQKPRHDNPKSPAFSRPVVYSNRNANFPTSADGWTPITGQNSRHKILERNNIYGRHNYDRQRNQISKKPVRSPPPQSNPHHAYLNQDTLPHASKYQHHPTLSKNYRDDQTHENLDAERLDQDQENEDLQHENDDEDEPEEKLPVSEYETHNDVPTKPIYPGEGLWATPGLKHRPFISKHEHTGLSTDTQDKPEGYETFESAAPTFERERSKYAEKIHSFPKITPKPHLKLDQHEDSSDDDHEEVRENDEEVEDNEEDEFVPTKLLAQVRKTENEEHLPSHPEDGRLKEVIKDSKIHTVYTEEGYEDIAYDHAGQEKNAEDSEGHAEFDKDALKLKNKSPKSKKSKSTEIAEADILREFENYNDPSKKHIESFDDDDGDAEHSDAEGSASSYQTPMLSTKNFATTNENITTEIKNMQDDDMKLEITSEVKIMTHPNNVSMAHKFVKIIPKNHESPNSNSSETATRTKRSVVDLHKIQVSKDFLDVFNAEKQRPTLPPPTSTEKYPYYEIRNSQLLHKNSPLRYAEDMKNIPKKVPGRMTFYEQSRVSECPEIPRNVNPIPDRVEEAHQKHQQPEEGSEEGGQAELPDVPRLRNLGDKIDCLKIRLFGENPLDSPIFQESIIEAPESIFQELDSFNDVVKNNNFKEIGYEWPKAQQILNEASQISHDLIEQVNHDHDEEQNADLEEEEESEELEEPYSASDNNEEYADNDADYQAVAQATKEAPLTTTTIKPKPTDRPVVTITPKTTLVTKPLEHVFRITEGPTTTTETIPPTQHESNAFFPRHIYDQIDFSQDLETETTTPREPSTSKASLQDQIVQTTEQLLPSTAIPGVFDSQNDLNATIIDANEEKLIIQVDESPPISDPNLHNNQARQPKAFDVILPSELGNENATTRRMDTEEVLPESSALRLQQRRRQRPQRPMYHVFDVNRFLPTPLPPIGHQLPYPLNKPIKPPQIKVFDITKFLPTPIPALVPYLTPNTPPPKHKTLSEVYYKDEIKPNEQLNVFADVINNIKNSPPETLEAEGSEHLPTVQDIPEPPKHHGKMKVPPRKKRIKQRASTSTTTTTSTTPTPRHRRKNKLKNHKTNAQIYEEYLQAIKSKDPDVQPTKALPPPKASIAEDQSQFTPIISQDLSAVDNVVGLSPPFSGFDVPVVYTLSNKNPFANHQQITESTTLNTFLVPGMKPPGKHKPLLYSDFRLLSHNRVRRKNNYHRIQKRSPEPYKPSYSEIRRGKPPKEEEELQEEKKEQEVEDEDDYVPKRNRNFHYDVETRKVVYDDKKEQEEDVVAEPPEEELTEEDEDDYLPLIKTTPKPPKPKFVVITTERNGPSFLEYVQQLKNKTDYKVIHDPTTKPPEEPTTKSDLKEVESTTKQADAPIPQFLSIVSKLKSNDDYKNIRDKKEKPTTTTTAPEEELEELEEPDFEITNSPGASQSSTSFDRKQIFDINEYLPQPKNYSPKTVIDYSKYKTIQRAPVPTRHSLSSRYNSDEDDLVVDTRRTTEAPVITASEDSAEASSLKNVDENQTHRRAGYTSSEEVTEKLEQTTTTTTEPTTTTQTIRIRMRGRKRPTTTTSAPTTTSATEATTKRRTRFRSRPTTTTESSLQENHSQPQRVVHRRRPIERYTRHNQNVPPNHKPLYTPLMVEEPAEVDSKPVVQRKRKVSRLVTPNRVQPENSSNETLEDSGKVGEIQPRKLDDVQVFRKYDHSKKHGGNYRREHEDSVPQALEANSAPPTAYEIEDSKEIRRLSDVVPKPFAFYSDPTLPGSVNQLKEPKASVEDLSTESGEAEPTASVEGRADKDYVDYEDEVRINFNKKSETATTNSVYIVKDPSKRLYYYAPV